MTTQEVLAATTTIMTITVVSLNIKASTLEEINSMKGEKQLKK